jgi:hypothetical protein
MQPDKTDGPRPVPPSKSTPTHGTCRPRRATRSAVIAAAGILPLHFSARQIRREPGEVIRLIKDTLGRGLNRPPLPIRTVPCRESPAANRAANQ